MYKIYSGLSFTNCFKVLFRVYLTNSPVTKDGAKISSQ